MYMYLPLTVRDPCGFTIDSVTDYRCIVLIVSFSVFVQRVVFLRYKRIYCLLCLCNWSTNEFGKLQIVYIR